MFPQSSRRQPENGEPGTGAAAAYRIQPQPTPRAPHYPHYQNNHELYRPQESYRYEQYESISPLEGARLPHHQFDGQHDPSASNAFGIRGVIQNAHSVRCEVSGSGSNHEIPVNPPADSTWYPELLSAPSNDGAPSLTSHSSQPVRSWHNDSLGHSMRFEGSLAYPPPMYKSSASTSDYTQSHAPFESSPFQPYDQSFLIDSSGVSADEVTKELGTHPDLLLFEGCQADDRQFLQVWDESDNENNSISRSSPLHHSTFNQPEQSKKGDTEPPFPTSHRQTERKPISLGNSQSVQKRDLVTGHIVGYENTFGPQKPQRRPLDPEKRASVATRRRMKACDKCRRRKKGCEYDSVYNACNKCRGTPEQPDCRLSVSLQDFNVLHVSDNVIDTTENAFNLKRCFSWQTDSDTTVAPMPSRRTLVLTQDVGKLTMEVSVRQYNTLSGDSITYTDQAQRSQWALQIPSYSLHNPEVVQVAALEYVRKAKRSCLEDFPTDCHPFLKKAFLIAGNSTDELLKECITLWVIGRLTEKSWYVVPLDTQEVLAAGCQQSSVPQKVPVTSVMDQQVDEVFLKILAPTRDKICQTLASQMKDRPTAKEHQFTLYLATVVLLSNLERQNAHERRFCDKHSLPERFWRTSSGEYPLWRARHHSANTLLGHYHHVLSEAMMSLDNVSVTKLEAGASTEENTKRLFVRTRAKAMELWGHLQTEHRYEQDMYWVHQMFLKNWSPAEDQPVQLQTPSDACKS